MTPTSAVKRPTPSSAATSKHDSKDDDTKKDKPDSIPPQAKRPLADAAAKTSAPPEGEEPFPPSDDGGKGNELDAKVPPAAAPVPSASPMAAVPSSTTPAATSPAGGGGAATEESKPGATAPPPAPKDPRGVSGQNVDNHFKNAKKEADALTTLTTNGNFEQVAGDDGKLSLYEAQQYLTNHPDAPPEVKEALKTITTNGDFERLAGGKGNDLTLPQMQQSLLDQQQEVASLQTVQQKFKELAGADERLSQQEVKDAAATTQDPALKSALDWMDANWEKASSTSYNADGASPYDGKMGTGVNQTINGNCARLAVLYGLSQTPNGKAKLEQMVDKQADGSYRVTLPGDADQKIYTVKPEELNEQWMKGDTGLQVVATTIEKWGADHPDAELRDPKRIMNLLTGNAMPQNVEMERPEDVKSYLKSYADEVNNGSRVMTLVGFQQDDGSTTFGQGVNHAYTVTSIDTAHGIVTYRNPWNSGQPHSISIDELSQQLADPNSLCWFNSTSTSESTADPPPMLALPGNLGMPTTGG